MLELKLIHVSKRDLQLILILTRNGDANPMFALEDTDPDIIYIDTFIRVNPLLQTKI